MPITLVVRAEGDGPEAGRSLTLDGTRIVIGRSAGCEVRLPDPSVSQRHATIQQKGAEYTLIDEGSTNGSFVGGVRLAPRAPRVLRDGDLVRVGRVWLEVRIEHRPATPNLAAATRDLALALVEQAMRSLGDNVHPRVRVVEGRDLGAELVLAEEGRAYLAGRGEHCDLPLADADASREHVRFVRRGSTVLVRDRGSTNGAFLGPERLPQDRDVTWPRSAMLRVGATVLALEEPVALALEELEAAPDEPMPAEEPPPPPPPSSRVATEAAPPSAGPVSAKAGGAAPIADVGTLTTKAPAKRKPLLSSTDVAVVIAALVVLGLSVAGLVWLLRG